ncbi:MAG: sigma factor-like helix-turn-helix DNA-binding protein, partial [Eubacteriales bacterium]
GFEISLNSHIDMGEGSVELIDTLVDENVDIEGNFVKKSEFHNLILALDLLTNRESQIIRMYYFENIGMKDIARKLGLAYRTVVNTKVNGVEKLRNTILSH